MVLFNRRKYQKPRRSPQGAPANIADATITVPESVTYTGSPLTPSVAVVYDGATLVVNTDYFVSYNDNTEIGAATVVVTGTGNYAGQVVKTFQIVSGGGGASWADFDFTNLGSPVAYKVLRDEQATYQPLQNINTYNLQVLPDGSIHFGAQAQGHAYIWGFEDGHPFEVSHFKSTYSSRGPATANNMSSILAPDGQTGACSLSIGTEATRFYLSSPYALVTLTKPGSQDYGRANIQGMCFSSDGAKFFHMQSASSLLYCESLSTAYHVDSSAGATSVDLGTVSGLLSTVTWQAFFFSPDGKYMVATSKGSSPTYECRVHKFSLSTPWDISTLAHLSSAVLFSYNSSNNPSAVAVNDSGTKMIVFNNYATDHTYRAFSEYNLTT